MAVDNKPNVAAVVKKIDAKVKKNKSASKNKINTNKLELLITVVNRPKTEFYADLIQSFDVNMQLILKAKGTATVEMLSLLGLEESKKSVIFSVIKQEKIKDALSVLEVKFNTIKNGKGIAYTVPMTSVIGVAIFGFLSNNTMTIKEDGNEKI